ncbi:MAG: DUF2589 domain-containing protein [Myxococcales bacterium]|nr:DUF2589 domain-containing protein [Myxococcales bacterium]
MAQISLDNLVAALASSVAEAEHVVRVHQVRNLRSFFNDDNEPVTVELQVPSLRSDAKGGETETLLVPLITLVSVSNMSIAEMEVNFSTELGDVTAAEEESPPKEMLEAMSFGGDDEAMRRRAEELADEIDRSELGWSESERAVAIDVTTSPTTSESGRASVTLKVRQTETPEGLARLIARLNRML